MMTICDVYKSVKQPEAYLYVDRVDGLTRVPDALLKKFANPTVALSFSLSEGKKFARTDAETVKSSLTEQGYYLQMPPVIVGELGRKKT